MSKHLENVSSFLKRGWSRQTARSVAPQIAVPNVAQTFAFFEVGELRETLRDDDLRLVLLEASVPKLRDACPQYLFEMRRDNFKVGNISLRIGDTKWLTHFAGHIGYGVEPQFRGRHYAARSVKLLLPLAKNHNINPLWITCNPDNWASRRSCEIAGAQFVEIVDLPTNCEMFFKGERQKCRYKIEL